MVEISNKVLASLLIVAIAVSLIGIYISITKVKQPSLLTGFASATGTGQVNLTVIQSTNVNWTTALLDFGTGSVRAGFPNCTLNNNESNNTASCSGFTGRAGVPLVIQNIGNMNTSLNLSFDKTAATMIGGTSPSFEFKVDYGEPGSCLNSTGGTGNDAGSKYQNRSFGAGPLTPVNFTPINASQQYYICPIVPPTQSNDTINVSLKIVIPADSFTGNMTATITATAYTPDDQ